MTDIVERLRGHPGEGQTVTEQFRNMVEQRHEAADDIERLREELADVRADAELLRAEITELFANNGDAANEIARLRVALQSMLTDPPATLDEPDTDAEVIIKMRQIARRALEPKP